MKAAEVLAVLAGVALTVGVLVSAVETVVLPRLGLTRLARVDFAVIHRILVHRWKNEHRREHLRGLFAPITLVILPLLWMMVVSFGFSLIFWGAGVHPWTRAFTVSGSSLLTLGFEEPHGAALTTLAFVEASLGLGLVALLISFLPVTYTAYNEREKGIMILRPFAGSPPDPCDLLVNLRRAGNADPANIWSTVSNWMIDLEQSHSSFPALCYFPGRTDQSWVASIGCVLESATMLVSAGSPEGAHPASGAVLALAYGVPSLGRVARAAGLPVEPAASLADLLDRFGEPAPEISVARHEYEAVMDRMEGAGLVEPFDRDVGWNRYAWLRSGYDRPMRGLAGLNEEPAAPMTTDRPADVGRPRLIGQRPVEVDWSLSVLTVKPSRPKR